MTQVPELNPCFNLHADATVRERHLFTLTTVIYFDTESNFACSTERNQIYPCQLCSCDTLILKSYVLLSGGVYI
jgi:hypothetical protein